MAINASQNDHVGKGIASICVAVFLFSIADATGKWLGHAGYAAPQIVFFRYLFGLVPVSILLWTAGFAALRTQKPFGHALRAVLLFAALVSLFTGLRYMPLAEAIAIAFTAPLFITVLSYPVLGERVGFRRWLAVIVGFAGALIMLRPGTEAFKVEALVIVAAALFFAFAMLLTRKLAKTETNIALFTYSTLGAGIASTPFMMITWQDPELNHLWIFFSLGIVGGIAAYCMILAYRHAPAAVAAPFEYTGLIWAAIIGWLVWQEQPGLPVWIGASIIGLSGLYITRREALSGQDQH